MICTTANIGRIEHHPTGRVQATLHASGQTIRSCTTARAADSATQAAALRPLLNGAAAPLVHTGWMVTSAWETPDCVLALLRGDGGRGAGGVIFGEP